MGSLFLIVSVCHVIAANICYGQTPVPASSLHKITVGSSTRLIHTPMLFNEQMLFATSSFIITVAFISTSTLVAFVGWTPFSSFQSSSPVPYPSASLMISCLRKRDTLSWLRLYTT